MILEGDRQRGKWRGNLKIDESDRSNEEEESDIAHKFRHLPHFSVGLEGLLWRLTGAGKIGFIDQAWPFWTSTQSPVY